MTPQSEQFVFRIEVYTSTLLISGAYTLQLYRRLIDALNSAEHPYIRLTDAIVSRLERPQQAERVGELLVDLGNMLLVTVLHEPDPPASYRPAVQGAPREVVPVMFFTSAFALQAKFYRRPDLRLEEMIERMNESFVPVKDVRVIPFHSPRSIGRDFACLGRAHIQALYVLSSTASEPGHTV